LNHTIVPQASARAATNRTNITPVQMQNINRLDLDLNGLGLATRDQAEQQRALIETLQAAPIGDTRPAPAAVVRLGKDLATVIPTLNLTAAQRRQLAIDVNLALNSGSLSPIEAQRVLTDVRTLLQGSMVNNAQGVEQLFAAMSSIVNQVQGAVAPSGAGQTATAGEPQAAPNSSSATPTQAGQSGANQTGQGSGSSRPATGTPSP